MRSCSPRPRCGFCTRCIGSWLLGADKASGPSCLPRRLAEVCWCCRRRSCAEQQSWLLFWWCCPAMCFTWENVSARGFEVEIDLGVTSALALPCPTRRSPPDAGRWRRERDRRGGPLAAYPRHAQLPALHAAPQEPRGEAGDVSLVENAYLSRQSANRNSRITCPHRQLSSHIWAVFTHS